MPSNQNVNKQEKKSRRRVRRRTRSGSESTMPDRISLETVQKAMLEPAALSTNDVLHLQRSIGNRTVGGVVSDIQTSADTMSVIQREGENPLTPVQVSMAIQYYRSR